MNRRLFLGLIGGSVVAAATPETLQALIASSPRTAGTLSTKRVYKIVVNAGMAGAYTVRRQGCEFPLMVFAVRQHSGYGWIAAPGCEIVVPAGQSLVIDGPGVESWTMIWDEQHADGRHVYCQSNNEPPQSMMLNDEPVPERVDWSVEDPCLDAWGAL